METIKDQTLLVSDPFQLQPTLQEQLSWNSLPGFLLESQPW